MQPERNGARRNHRASNAARNLGELESNWRKALALFETGVGLIVIGTLGSGSAPYFDARHVIVWYIVCATAGVVGVGLIGACFVLPNSKISQHEKR